MPTKTINIAPKVDLAATIYPTSCPNPLLKRTEMSGNEREILKILPPLADDNPPEVTP